MSHHTRSMLGALAVAMLAGALAAAPPARAQQAEITGEGTVVRADLTPAGCVGFTVSSGEEAVAVVRWTSGDRWVCRAPAEGASSLRFAGFTAPGTPSMAFDDATEIVVSLAQGDPFPHVSFSLDVTAFDPEAWPRDWGEACPFTFLRCSLPEGADEGQLLYQGGELYPGPRVDPFPITQTHMKGSWAPNWSYMPALGAAPIPAVGLWSPESRLFVTYEFQEPRSTDQSDYLIASTYCAGRPAHPAQFLALGSPHAQAWLNLRLPEGPFRLGSRFRLLYNTDMPSTDDPNRWVIRELLRTYADRLPPAPRMNDMSWLKQGREASQILFLKDLGEAVQPVTTNVAPPLYRTWEQCEKVFFDPGTVQLCAHQTGKASAYAWLVGDEAGLAEQKRQLDELVRHAKLERFGEDECWVWDHPLEGSFNRNFGGPEATGTRHMFNWAIASAMLGFYRHRGAVEYLPYLDGMVKWTRHYLYDRAGMADLPWAVFSMGAANGGEFLLDYYYTFRDDPERKALAEEAWRLADVVVYRNLYPYTSDPNWDDNLDPTFLLQAVNAFPWLGMVTWGEMGRVPEMAIQMYLETGDPYYEYLVRGCLERFYVGTISYAGNYTENLQVFGETGPKGTMSGGWGGNNFRWLAEPLGSAIVQVDVGPKGALAFCRGTRAVDVTDYAYRPDANFGFTVAVDPAGLHAPEGPFDVQITAPRRDLHGSRVRVNGAELPAERYVVGTAGTDVLVRGVQAGDRVTLGEVGPADAVAGRTAEARPSFAPTPSSDFECLPLDTGQGAVVDNTWQGEWAGLWPGPGAANGVSYAIVDADALAGRAALDLSAGVDVPIEREGPVVLLWGLPHRPEKRFGPTTLGTAAARYADGAVQTVEVRLEGSAEVRRGMTWYDKDWLLLQVPIGEAGKTIQSVHLDGTGLLVGATVARPDSERGRRAVAGVLRAQEEKLRSLSYQGWAVPLEVAPVSPAWEVPQYPYRFLVALEGGSGMRHDPILRVREALDALFAQVGAGEVPATPAVRVFEVGADGRTLGEVPAQFEPGPDLVSQGELLLKLPGEWDGAERRFMVYLGNGPRPPSPSPLRCTVTEDAVTFDSGAARGTLTLRAGGIGPRLTELAFGGGPNLLAKAGWDEGFGHLCAVQDNVTWYDFPSLQKGDAKAEIVSAGPLALTFRVTGLEVFGEGTAATTPGVGTPGAASVGRKGLAEWYFRLYADDPRIDSWVHSTLTDLDTRWTRPMCARFGTAGKDGARTVGTGSGRQGTGGAEGGLALVALDDLAGRGAVQPAYTKEDGAVLGISLEGSTGLGAYRSARWRMMPDTGDAAFAEQGAPVHVRQWALERLVDGTTVREAPASVEIHEPGPSADWLEGLPESQVRTLAAGTPDGVHGLRNRENPDEGESIRGTVAGSTVIRQGTTPAGGAQQFVYFDVVDGVPGGTESARAYVVVEYYDVGFGSVAMQYDSSDQTVHVTPATGAFKEAAQRLPLGDTREWRTFAFALPDAHFRDRCNGADFRLDLASGQVLVRRLVVVFPDAR